MATKHDSSIPPADKASIICHVCIQGDKRRSDELPSRPSTQPEVPKRQHVNLPQLQARLSELVGRPLSGADMSKITGLSNYQALASTGSDIFATGNLPGMHRVCLSLLFSYLV